MMPRNQSTWTLHNFRDSIMFENIKFLRKETNSKLLFWGASAHTMKAPEKVEGPDGGYEGYRPLGKLLDEAFGKEVYSLGFTAAKGTFYGYWDKELHQIEEGLEFSLENEIHARFPKRDFVFADLASADSSFYSKVLGNELIKGRWSENFDAMVYIREMEPSRF